MCMCVQVYADSGGIETITTLSFPRTREHNGAWNRRNSSIQGAVVQHGNRQLSTPLGDCV